jgi:hypothetical protein
VYHVAVVAAATVLTATVAAAQAPPSAPNPDQPTAVQPDRRACAQPRLPVAPPQKHGSTGTNGTTSNGAAPLSDQLARSDGVICPPGQVDSEIVAPAPNTGRMPVIPPPGSPGGDQSVRPK